MYLCNVTSLGLTRSLHVHTREILRFPLTTCRSGIFSEFRPEFIAPLAKQRPHSTSEIWNTPIIQERVEDGTHEYKSIDNSPSGAFNRISSGNRLICSQQDEGKITDESDSHNVKHCVQRAPVSDHVDTLDIGAVALDVPLVSSECAEGFAIRDEHNYEEDEIAIGDGG